MTNRNTNGSSKFDLVFTKTHIYYRIMQQTELINQMWKDFISYGYLVRSRNENGLEKWNELKKIYAWLDQCQYLPQKIIMEQSEIKKIIQDETFDINHDNIHVLIKPINQILDNRVDYQHFFIQHFRIPIMTNFQVHLIKFFQIAYNIGQMSASYSRYTPEQLEFYHQHRLNEFTQYYGQNGFSLI